MKSDESDVICCHNCGWYGDPIKWICATDNCTFRDIALEIKQGVFGASFIENYFDNAKTVAPTAPTPQLPKDSIKRGNPIANGASCALTIIWR